MDLKNGFMSEKAVVVPVCKWLYGGFRKNTDIDHSDTSITKEHFQDSLSHETI